MVPDNLTESEKRELLSLLEDKQRILDETKLYRYKPYPKQLDFHDAGGDPAVRERLLKAGNQLGKTWSAAFETAMHLTGRYPDWWEGKRFRDPAIAWGASMTSQVTRDTIQRMLLGQVGSYGTGAIPKADIVEIKRAAHGVADSVESILVRHITGGISRITLKSYDQGRERFQGETLDFVWFDEEPPLDIYTEGLTRTNATQGIVWITFTPLMGMSDVVKRFLIDKVPGTDVTNMTIYDAEHYTEDQRKAIIASYPAHEREARAMGVPTLGSGKIFPVEESMIRVNPFPIPDYFVQIGGIDFGWDHPTAACKIAWDRDNDVIYVTACYRQTQAQPVVHAAAIKAWGDWLPIAWPHDGNNDTAAGSALAGQYRTLGLKMLNEHATNEGGGNSVEAGLMEMLDRMTTGRWKVFSTCEDWFEEFRLYHRKDGKVVKVADDALSASRYAYMMRRFAKPKKQTGTKAIVKPFQSTDSGMGLLG